MALAWYCLLIVAGLALGLTSQMLVGMFGFASLLLAGAAVAARLLRSPVLASVLLAAALFMTGVWRGGVFRPGLKQASPLNEMGQHSVVCVVASDPERHGLYLSFYCNLVSVDGQNQNGRVGLLVTMPATVAPELGDRVTFQAELATPSADDTFDYRQYLARRGVSALAFAESANVVERSGNSWLRFLYSWRMQVAEGIRRNIPEPEAAFINGVLLGVDAGLPEGVRDDLRSAGLLHILVVSGFNVSLLVAGLVALLRRVSGWGLCFGAVAMLGVLYAALTGGDPPVVRAVIMALVALGAKVVGRPSRALPALALAATVMAIQSPVLLLEPSYQLSVTATAGMIWADGLPLALKHASSLLAPLLSGLITTLAVQMASLPVMVSFGQLPLLGLLSNSAVLPLQGPLMLAAIVAAVATYVPGPLAMPASFLAWLLTRCTLAVAHLVARLPLATMQTERWPSLIVVAYYVGLAAMVDLTTGRHGLHYLSRLATGTRRIMPKVSSLAACAMLAVAVWAVALQLPDGRLHIAFLDVGQGDAILITTPSGRRVLIDGGRDPEPLLAHLGRALPFWRHDLDVVVLTHADMDHMGGLLDLPGRYHAGALVTGVTGAPEPWRKQWLHLCNVARVQLGAGWGLRMRFADGVVFDVLYPPATGCPDWAESDNDCSAVMSLRYGGATALFTGDAEERVEKLLVSEGILQPTWLLKVAHHGSARCTGDDLLRTLSPSLAVISVGENRYGHPSVEVLKRLTDHDVAVLRTDQLGTIEVVSDGQRYVINTGL